MIMVYPKVGAKVTPLVHSVQQQAAAVAAAAAVVVVVQHNNNKKKKSVITKKYSVLDRRVRLKYRHGGSVVR